MNANRSSVVELARQSAGAFFHWESPGELIAVYFHLNVIDMLERDVLCSGPRGAAGVLLGRIENGRTPTVVVEDCEAIQMSALDGASDSSYWDPEAWAAVLDRWHSTSGKRISILGLYRSSGPGQATLNDSDRAILNSNPTRSEQVFLVIERRGGGHCSGFLFMAKDGAPLWQWNTVPFNRKELGGRASALHPASPNVQQPPLQPVELLSDEEEQSRPRREKWSTADLMLHWKVGLLAALIFAVGLLYVRGGQGLRADFKGYASGSGSTVGLKVERSGNDLLVSWDRNSPILQNATAGRLLVEDGNIQRTLDLDLKELRGGTILYSPMSDNAVLRLDVLGTGSATESVRVVGNVLPPLPAQIPIPAPRPLSARAGSGPTAAATRPAISAPPAAAAPSSSAVPNPKSEDAAPMETGVPQARLDSLSMPRPRVPLGAVRPGASPNSAAPEVAIGATLPVVELSLGERTAPRATDAKDKFEPARLVSGKEPEYPPLARATNLSGTVEVTFQVNAKGAVGKVDIVKGAPAFAQPVLDALRTRVYEPAKLNGNPVESDLRVAYVFKPQ